MLRIGFVYDAPPGAPLGASHGEDSLDSSDTVAAEYEDQRTIQWLVQTLEDVGQVIEIPWGRQALTTIAASGLDVIFNITEAGGSRNREGLVPSIAEACGIPCTGSDALALSTSLDKNMTKILGEHCGIPTAPFVLIGSEQELHAQRNVIERIGYPVIAKPNTGGSSMGVRLTSRAETWCELKSAVMWALETFDDAVLVERFIRGSEYTAGLIERDGLETFPIAEVRLNGGDPNAFYSIEQKSVHQKEVICPAGLPQETAQQIDDYARKLFVVLGCRGTARVDFRVDISDNVAYLLEINPLPGLSPYYSILPRQAEVAGISPAEIVRALVIGAVNGRNKQNRRIAKHA